MQKVTDKFLEGRRFFSQLQYPAIQKILTERKVDLLIQAFKQKHFQFVILRVIAWAWHCLWSLNFYWLAFFLILHFFDFSNQVFYLALNFASELTSFRKDGVLDVALSHWRGPIEWTAFTIFTCNFRNFTGILIRLLSWTWNYIYSLNDNIQRGPLCNIKSFLTRISILSICYI